MRGQPWTRRERNRVETMKARGFDWDEIAAAVPGRTAEGCKADYYKTIRNHRDDPAPPKIKREKLKALAQAYVAKPVPVPVDRVLPYPSGRAISTQRLLIEAELRQRISERGLTAGLLGDPAPGRSALEAKRAGEAV